MILVFITDRANYGRLKPLLQLMDKEDVANVICWAGAITADGWGQRFVISDLCNGHPVGIEVLTQIASDTPRGECKSISICVDEFSRVLDDVAPTHAIVIGDRYQALAAAVACTYHHVDLIHIQGGERSGTVDNAARNAITKLADWHVPATELAAQRLLRMGEDGNRIITTGCPSTDMFSETSILIVDKRRPDVSRPIVVIYHPCREDATDTFSDIVKAVQAVSPDDYVVFWPNIDQGHVAIDEQMRRMVPKGNRIKTLAPEAYYQLLENARCLVGNSSSFVRDSGWFGTPVLLVGKRQIYREHATNTLVYDQTGNISLEEDIRAISELPKFNQSTIYGDGHVCERIVAWLKEPKVAGVKL